MGSRKERLFTFVIVETDSGISRIGDAFGNQTLMGPIIERQLANKVIGMDPFDIETLWKKLFSNNTFWEVEGSVICAIISKYR
jgi:L-alanine-DL-glutamate epimerase-like enolase superfamily enzyme